MPRIARDIAIVGIEPLCAFLRELNSITLAVLTAWSPPPESAMCFKNGIQDVQQFIDSVIPLKIIWRS